MIRPPEETTDEPKPTDAAQVETVSTPEDTPPRSSRARRFNVYVGDRFFEVEVDPVGGRPYPAAAGEVGDPFHRPHIAGSSQPPKGRQ